MSSLEDIRKQVKHSESLVTRKIRRMANTQDGYDVTGTKLDPRKPKGWIDRATRKQLESYAASLKYFRRPSVGWVKSANGTPIRRQVIKNAESAARTRNRRVMAIESGLAAVKVPWAGNRAYGEIREERNAAGAGRRRRINDEQGVRTTTRVKRRSINYSSEKAAMRTAKMNRELDSERQVRFRIAKTRYEVEQMLEGEPELLSMVQSMSDAQFWFAWTATGRFSNALKLVYEHNFGNNPSNDVYRNETRDVELIVREAKRLAIKEESFWA